MADRILDGLLVVLVFLIVGTLLGCLAWMFVFVWSQVL
jgi:hypothetical protein